MRLGPSARVLSAASSWQCLSSSWLGGRVLADVVPLTRGRVTWSTSRRVQADLKLTVPRFTVEAGRTVDWLPTGPQAALARFGQVLDASILAEGVAARLGRFLITEWKQTDGAIEVSAAGLLQTAADDRLLTATAPRDDGTLKSEFLRLLPGYMTAQFHPALQDRACPKGMEWSEDRLAALYEIADAWPARLREDSWGQVQVLPPLTPITTKPVVSLTDGVGGTVITAPLTDTREGGYNVFVARSSAPDVDAQAIAQVSGGPMDPNGDYRPVPKFFASPLLLTEAQCLAAAITMRDESVRSSRIRRVTMAPDPRIELDDPVELIVDKGTVRETRDWGRVVGVDMPLTVADGDMRVDVAIS